MFDGRPARRLKPTLSPSTQFGRRCLSARCTSGRNGWSPQRHWWRPPRFSMKWRLVSLAGFAYIHASALRYAAGAWQTFRYIESLAQSGCSEGNLTSWDTSAEKSGAELRRIEKVSTRLLNQRLALLLRWEMDYVPLSATQISRAFLYHDSAGFCRLLKRFIRALGPNDIWEMCT